MGHSPHALIALLAFVLLGGPAAAAPPPNSTVAAGETTPGATPLPGLGGGPSVPVEGAPFSAEPPAPEDLEDNPDLAEPPVDGTRVPDFPVPVVHYGTDGLPPAVEATREALIAAAKTGDMEALRPLLTKSDPPTIVSNLDDGDPIEVLKAESGDEDGREVLAILLDLLDAGWVEVDEGAKSDRFVFPYFARYPLAALDPRQTVELFRIMTAGDLEGMRGEGVYTFFRVEIGKDGTLLAFVSGE